MGPLSWPEILIILVVLLLLFGAKRLPEMGRSLGRGMREFKDAVTGNEDPKQTELNAPVTTTAPTPPASPAPTETAPQQPQQPNSERAAS
jgi:sec-independent protein translocase protein TatA